ncbi:hypothetical protein FHR32_004978 [Streptosporangium album]|uniref:Uncharacterized protein n=1 Tax=Streptosporangium album TaxID=47479 RepID=A0A7W7S098_9ACTN|nr:hypothetical protein [Streptosporangium album]
MPLSAVHTATVVISRAFRSRPRSKRSSVPVGAAEECCAPSVHQNGEGGARSSANEVRPAVETEQTEQTERVASRDPPEPHAVTVKITPGGGDGAQRAATLTPFR